MNKYQKIAEEIKSKILQHDYPNYKLPTEDKLVEEYKTSKNTIRNATQLLIEKGMVYRKHGSGVYIRQLDNRDSINANFIRGISSEFQSKKVSNKILKFELRQANEQEAKELQIDIGQEIYKVVRVRYLDGKPFTIEHALYDKAIIPYLSKEIVDESIFNYIENDLKLKIGHADKYISAIVMDKATAALLELSEGEPALQNREKIYLSNGQLFNSSRVIYHYKDTELFINALN